MRAATGTGRGLPRTIESPHILHVFSPRASSRHRRGRVARPPRPRGRRRAPAHALSTSVRAHATPRAPTAAARKAFPTKRERQRRDAVQRGDVVGRRTAFRLLRCAAAGSRSYSASTNRGLRRADASASPRNDRPATLCSSAPSTVSVGSADLAARRGSPLHLPGALPQLAVAPGPAARGPVPSTPKNKRARSARPRSSPQLAHAAAAGGANKARRHAPAERHVAGPLEARAASNKIVSVAQGHVCR